MDQVGMIPRLRTAAASIQLRNIVTAALLALGAFVGWQQSSVLSQAVSFVAAASALSVASRFLL